MATQDKYIQLSSLPEDVRKQVLDYIEFLMERHEEKPASAVEPEAPQLKKRPIGMFKGKIRMANDFDAPLDDFRLHVASFPLSARCINFVSWLPRINTSSCLPFRRTCASRCWTSSNC